MPPLWAGISAKPRTFGGVTASPGRPPSLWSLACPGEEPAQLCSSWQASAPRPAPGELKARGAFSTAALPLAPGTCTTCSDVGMVAHSEASLPSPERRSREDLPCGPGLSPATQPTRAHGTGHSLDSPLPSSSSASCLLHLLLSISAATVPAQAAIISCPGSCISLC